MRLLAQRRRRGSDVDQIAVVRDDRVDAGLGDPPPEQHDLVLGQHAGTPLADRLGEDLQRLAARRDGAIDGARQTAGDGQMGAEPRHQSPKTSPRTGRRAHRCRQASGGRPALTQVWRRNCSRVPAPLGRDLRQQQPAVKTLLDHQAMHADGEGVGPRLDLLERPEHRNLERQLRQFARAVTGGNRGSSLAESAAQRTTSAARPARFCSVPRQPRSCPRSLDRHEHARRIGQSTATAPPSSMATAATCASIDARASASSVCRCSRGQHPSPAPPSCLEKLPNAAAR